MRFRTDLFEQSQRGPDGHAEPGKGEASPPWPAVGEHEDALEIEVEWLGGRSALGALATTLAGQMGMTYARFVAKPYRTDSLRPVAEVVGPSFPSSWWPLEDRLAQGAWSEDMARMLDEMDKRLVREGWKRIGRGEHWWSIRYTRPAAGTG